jgi:rod shape-determining protein MreC
MVVFFASAQLFGFSGNIKNAFFVASSPVQKVFWNSGNRVSNLFEAFYNVKNLKTENDYLARENKRLLAEIAVLENAKMENEILRQALNIGMEESFDLVFAEITAKQGDFIIIDKGLEQGILENMPVVTAQKIVCGKIKEVYKDFSRVMLITSEESSFGVKIQGKEIFGLVKGGDKGFLYLDRIPKDKEINEHDIINTTSLGDVFPKGLLVGKIKKVSRSDADPFQQAELHMFCDINNLQSLFVITGY